MRRKDPLQLGAARDGDWHHEAQKDPLSGFLQHTGGDFERGKRKRRCLTACLWTAIRQNYYF